MGHVQGTAAKDNVVRAWRGHQHGYGARPAFQVLFLMLRRALVRSTSPGYGNSPSNAALTVALYEE